jgi:hypothetical protein
MTATGGAAATPTLYQYPAQAAYGRVLPKAKVYAHGHAGTRVRGLFVAQVEQIVWQYKLAPETTNLPAGAGVGEIQIFTLHLKTPELDPQVLRCLDGAIPFPIIYELAHGPRRQMVAAYKAPKDAKDTQSSATAAVLASDHFSSGWLPADAPRQPLPVALHLGSLYEQLLRPLLPLPARDGETLADQVARAAQARAKQREVTQAEARLAREPQFNRKVEVNAVLRQLRSELAALQR